MQDVDITSKSTMSDNHNVEFENVFKGACIFAADDDNISVKNSQV